ncbi:armadillo-type protein [Blakeslea trispora]|nr:armadillo-type protein [Blakeslea trispora]
MTATFLQSIDIYELSNQKDKQAESETMIVHPENIQETTPLENQHHKEQLPPYTEQDQVMLPDTDSLLKTNEDYLSQKVNDVTSSSTVTESDLLENDLSASPLQSLVDFSKSTLVLQRLVVVRDIPALLPVISAEQAIDTVLPIIVQLSKDSDDAVKELLAGELDKIMYFYYMNWPPDFSTDIVNDKPHTPRSSFAFTIISLLLSQNASLTSAMQQSLVTVAMELAETPPNSARYQLHQTILQKEIFEDILGGLTTLFRFKQASANTTSEDENNRDSISKHTTINTELFLNHDNSITNLAKMVYSMLLTALAQTFGSTGYAEKTVPIIEMLAKDSMFYVRKEVAISLGSLATVIPLSMTIERLIPLYSDLSADKIWHVRKACVITLPLLCETMPDNLKEKMAVDSVHLFKKDDSKSVYNTLADIVGELITKFLPKDWKETGQPGNVPEELLTFFLSLGKPVIANANFVYKSDSECIYSCAYSFPAVVLTMGADYWDSHLKDAYIALAKDYQLRVRCTLACSLHEIARIIGFERTKSDLVHIFALYLMDLDIVKQGVLEHLSEFLSVLDVDTRNDYVPILIEVWDSVMNNWHLREILTIQLQDMARLFDASRVIEYILPLAIKACHDEYAAVREACVDIFPVILDIVKKSVHEGDKEVSAICETRAGREKDEELSEKQQQALALLNYVVERLEELVHSSNYRTRLVFAQICRCLLEAGISSVDFASFFLPRVSLLARDPVVNVRIAISRMALSMLSIDGYIKELEEVTFDVPNYSTTPRQIVQEMLYCLSTDSDSDVRSFVVDHVSSEMLKDLEVTQNNTSTKNKLKEDFTLRNASLLSPPESVIHIDLSFDRCQEDSELIYTKEVTRPISNLAEEDNVDDFALTESPMDIVNEISESWIDTSYQKDDKDNICTKHDELLIVQEDQDGDLIMTVDDHAFDKADFNEPVQITSSQIVLKKISHVDSST